VRQNKTAIVREREKRESVREKRGDEIKNSRQPRVAGDAENELLEPDVQPERERCGERDAGEREIQREEAMPEARVLLGLLLAGGVNGHGGSVFSNQYSVGRKIWMRINAEKSNVLNYSLPLLKRRSFVGNLQMKATEGYLAQDHLVAQFPETLGKFAPYILCRFHLPQ